MKPENSPSLPLLRTPVDVGSPVRLIGARDINVFLGSCFSEYVGERFYDCRLYTLNNPLGVLYNARSIARVLKTSMMERKSRPRTHDYVKGEGMWHSWLGDSSLSRTQESACRKATNEALDTLHRTLPIAHNLFLTLGTTHYYVEKARGEVVANCHRLPSDMFREAEMSVSEVVECLSEVLLPLHEANPRIQVIFTVSPYRYRKYGFHESQLAKSRLLLAVDELVQSYPEWMCYFPAYELLMDELRDYRFYAEDMLHPSEQAVEYIWQRLVDAWFTDDAKEFLKRWEPIRRALRHRPLHPEGAAFEAFRKHVQTQLEQLQRDYPKLGIPNLEF